MEQESSLRARALTATLVLVLSLISLTLSTSGQAQVRTYIWGEQGCFTSQDTIQLKGVDNAHGPLPDDDCVGDGDCGAEVSIFKSQWS